jgi:hypothetical protein
MTAPRLPAIALCLSASSALSACGFSPPLSETQRAAIDACRSDADRTYNAQNRYQLSERDTRDTPFSSTAAPTQSDTLSDQYGHDQLVSDCVNHSAAVPVAGGNP